jgi:hypothetical protein
MLDIGVMSEAGDGEFVQFFQAGTPVKGEFHCADCGYGVTVHRALPDCPMCAGSSWIQADWSPFRRHSATLL